MFELAFPVLFPNLRNQTTCQSFTSSSTDLKDLFMKENHLCKSGNSSLQFRFNDGFPFEAPEVIFIGAAIPVHPHIYTNGFICLSILYDEWTPALRVSSIVLSI